MYIANHYVRVAGKMYIKGEEIKDGLTEEKIAWLMQAGAIKEVTPAAPVKETVQETETEEEPPQEPEEPEADEEPIEIDVMAGIVQTEADEEPQKNERKTAAKKQAGRRKSG